MLFRRMQHRYPGRESVFALGALGFTVRVVPCHMDCTRPAAVGTAPKFFRAHAFIKVLARSRRGGSGRDSIGLGGSAVNGLRREASKALLPCLPLRFIGKALCRGGEGHGGGAVFVCERGERGIIHKVKNPPLVGKFNLRFRGVYVHIHAGKVDI